MQDFTTRVAAVSLALVDEKSRIVTDVTARAFFDNSETMLNETFQGGQFPPITEANGLAAVNGGAADDVKAFLSSYQSPDGQFTSGVLI